MKRTYSTDSNIVLSKKYLEKLYISKKMSAKEIADVCSCSQNKINYWLTKHNIQKRTLSDALYVKQNPNGDPFKFKKLQSNKDWFLFGLGIGLYWGEGNKKNEFSVRLGNTDPYLILHFLKFLKEIYNVEDHKMRFGLQVFNDMNPNKALKYWSDFLNVDKSKFMETVVTPARSVGTYKEKSKYGVLTVYVSNKKLRNMICNEIETLQQMR